MEMTKKLESRVFWFILILLLGLAFYFIFSRVFVSPEEKALKELEALEKAYQEDTYGGATPEETLQLFIDALKAGDIDLASKYFLPEDREKMKIDLMLARDEHGEGAVVERIEKLKLRKKDNESASFVIMDENNIINIQVILDRNINGIWKIIDL